jgi:phage terminase large subunit GpA-like protein
MTPAAEKLRDHLRMIYAPIDRRTVVEWCEQELILSERQTQMPGQFSTALTPYLREPLECFGDVDVTDIILVFGTQTGKTTMIQAGTGWRVVNKPTPIVWVMPNEKLAKSFSETRWIPICEDSPALQAVMPRDRHKWQKLEQHFARCSLVFVGSNSPANLASRPAGLLLMDEVDKFRDETEKETSALLLAENRTKSFAGALRVKTSTPTMIDGEIWQEYLKGSCEQYFLPCPHCGEFVLLSFDGIKWNPEAKNKETGKWDLAMVFESARFECPACKGHWNDGMKIEALPKGQWRATNPRALPGVRSFHLPSFYAPWRSCSFGALATKFLQDKSSVNGLRDFRNSTEAMPWEETEAEINPDHLTARRSKYSIGSVPAAATVRHLFVGADVALAFTNYVVRAFSDSGESWLVDYGRVSGVEDFVATMDSSTWNINGKAWRITGGLIDSGYQAEHVYRACVEASRRGLRIFPSKGSGEKFVAKPVRVTDMMIGGKTFKRSLVIYSDNDFKRLLYIERVRDAAIPWWIPETAGEDYTVEMLKERQVAVKNARGYEEMTWKRIGPNHYADAEKLTLVYWSSL